MVCGDESLFSMVGLGMEGCWGSVLSVPLSMEPAEGRRKDGGQLRKGKGISLGHGQGLAEGRELRDCNTCPNPGAGERAPRLGHIAGC